MLIAYLDVPYPAIEDAKLICKLHKLPMITFDGQRKKWYYRGDNPPPVLTRQYPVLEIAEEPKRTYNAKPIAKAAPSKFKLTPEQEVFVNTEPSGPDNLLIGRAFAGAAKTTTMREYTQARPNASFLLLAFSAAVAQTGRETFPGNTVCTTIHALARRWLPDDLKKKIGDGEDLKADVICQLLGVQPKADNLHGATFIRMLLHGFFVSSDSHPQMHHLGHTGDLLTATSWALGRSIEDYLRHAQTIWEMMRDPSHPAPLTHDGYLKLYALSRPTWEFDYALLDEGQDTNPVTEDIFFQQKLKKLVVGDPHQNIFVFRLARDILSPRAHGGSPCVNLTHSFRFGPEVAAVANVVLQDFKAEKVDVIGRGHPAQILAPDTAQWDLNPDGTFTPFTWIARSNGELFNAAVEILQIMDAYERVFLRPAPKIAFIGTSERTGFSPFHAYKFGRLLDLARLAMGERDKIHDPFISRFGSLEELSSLVNDERTSDPDLASAIRIYRRYKNALPYFVHKIGERCGDPKSPDVWVRFSTAHKSKGLEWPRVRLAEDFVPLCEEKRGKKVFVDLAKYSAEDFNLLYVAITRAQLELELNSRTALYLAETGRQALMSNWMPGMLIAPREPVKWESAVKRFGGDPVAIRQAIEAERAATKTAAAARKTK